MKHNSHVLKWYRWQAFLAGKQGRLMAQTFFIQWHNDEQVTT